MSSRYDELERLQRLRESGALTDDEFQAEKMRVLGVSSSPPDPDSGAAEGAVSRRPLYWALGGLALSLAVAAGLFVGRMVGGPSDGETVNSAAPAGTDIADENLIAPAAAPDVRTLPGAEQLARAFEAAFGSGGAASVEIGGDLVRFSPGRLLWTAIGPVLVSAGEAPDAPHASGGHVAIHYLRPSGDRFEVAGRFVPAVTSGSSGRLGQWSVSGRFGNRPVIVTEGGGTWQGYTCSVATLTELSPTGPIELVTVPLSYSDAGAREEGQATEIEGRIGNIAKGRSFEVRYSGSDEFVARYVRSGSRYVLEGGGEPRMRTC